MHGQMKLIKIWRNINFLFIAFYSSTCFAQSDSFTHTLETALKTNPTLQAARAAVAEARSNLKTAQSERNPSFRLESEAGLAHTSQKSKSGQSSFGSSGGQSGGISIASTAGSRVLRQKVRPRAGKAIVEQPLYKGGRITAGINKACYELQAIEFKMQSTENNLIHNVANAYLDVVLAQTKLKLQKKTEHVLRQHLEAARVNLKIGSTTRTDVAQAKSRFEGARADRLQAGASLREAQAHFEKLVGYPPQNLNFPEIQFSLPKNLQEAIRQAECDNPELTEARYNEQASDANLREVKGELLPTLSLRGEAGESHDQFFKNVRTRTSGVYANLSIPLYSSGSTINRIKAARHAKKQKRYSTEEKLRDIRARVTAAFENVHVQQAKIQARKAESKAANIALQGLKLEAKGGSRTVLDVLDGEKEALDAQLNLLQARADYVDAGYELMKLVGRIERSA